MKNYELEQIAGVMELVLWYDLTISARVETNIRVIMKPYMSLTRA